MARRLCACLLGLALLGASGTAAGDPGSEKHRVDRRIGELQGKVAAADRQAGVLTEQLSATAGRVRELEAGVAAQQRRLQVLETELAGARSRLAVVDRRLTAQTTALARLRREHAVAVTRLEEHVRAIYVSDDPDVVAVVLGARSFSELLDSLELLGRIGQQDRAIAQQVALARDRMASARARTRRERSEASALTTRIASQAEEQRSVVARLAASRDALVGAQADRRAALGAISSRRSDVLGEIDALQAQSARLAAVIRSSQAPASSPTAPPVTGTGTLQWPVSGAVTSPFGRRWGRMHEGIDIAVPSGTPVHAAASGTVVYAGWMSGYGNIVVLDHGNGLSTAYGHNTSVAVSVGQSVETGQTIALSGSTGHSTGPHVHFEVRVNGVPVDPLGYL